MGNGFDLSSLNNMRKGPSNKIDIGNGIYAKRGFFTGKLIFEDAAGNNLGNLRGATSGTIFTNDGNLNFSNLKGGIFESEKPGQNIGFDNCSDLKVNGSQGVDIMSFYNCEDIDVNSKGGNDQVTALKSSGDFNLGNGDADYFAQDSKSNGTIKNAESTGEIPDLQPSEPQAEASEAVVPPTEKPLVTTKDLPAPEKQNGSPYKVQSGDSLWNIAKQQLGEGASQQDIAQLTADIAKHNNISDPNKINEGQELKLPPKEEQGKADAKTVLSSSNQTPKAETSTSPQNSNPANNLPETEELSYQEKQANREQEVRESVKNLDLPEAKIQELVDASKTGLREKQEEVRKPYREQIEALQKEKENAPFFGGRYWSEVAAPFKALFSTAPSE